MWVWLSVTMSLFILLLGFVKVVLITYSPTSYMYTRQVVGGVLHIQITC